MNRPKKANVRKRFAINQAFGNKLYETIFLKVGRYDFPLLGATASVCMRIVIWPCSFNLIGCRDLLIALFLFMLIKIQRELWTWRRRSKISWRKMTNGLRHYANCVGRYIVRPCFGVFELSCAISEFILHVWLQNCGENAVRLLWRFVWDAILWLKLLLLRVQSVSHSLGLSETSLHAYSCVAHGASLDANSLRQNAHTVR